MSPKNPKIQTFKYAKKGFTLMELMIVITIIMILAGITLFPYRYYTQRAYVERASDMLAQEWILAHRSVRGGIQYDSIAKNQDAHMLIRFKKGSSSIDTYLLSGAMIPNGFLDPNFSLPEHSIKKYKTILLEDGVSILGFSGALNEYGDDIGYQIYPPYGSGGFFTGALNLTASKTGTIIIGYTGAGLSPGLSREILLRTYLH